jgi:hypothetical protein
MKLSSGTISSGTKANITGNRLEKFVEQALQDAGYIEFLGHKLQVFDNRKTIGGKQYLKQLRVGETIYSTSRKCDFFIVNRDKFENDLIIECKWQQSGGSVDEKYPFLLHNIVKTGIPTVILLDGGGFKRAAMKWLKDQVGGNSALKGVWNMSEFQKEINDGFLG